MGARDAIARLRRTQAPEPRELLLSRRQARLIVDSTGRPPLDYADEPMPFEAQPMFGLCETILIGGMAVSLSLVLIWHIVRMI